MNDVIIVDGTNLVHRVYYVHKHLSNSKGIHTGAIFGFFRMMLYYADKLGSKNLIFCWEGGGENWRKRLLPEYKGNRIVLPTNGEFKASLDPKRDEKLKHKIEIDKAIASIVRLSYNAGITNVYKTNFESDDCIGYLVKRLRKNIKIISKDKDMMQFVNDDKKVRVVYPDQKMSYKIINEKEVEKMFGVPPHKIVDLLSLTGDGVDGIPGLKGYGDKTAIKRIKENSDICKGLCRADVEVIYRNRALINLIMSPIELSQSNLYYKLNPDVMEVKKQLKLFEIKSFSTLDLIKLGNAKDFKIQLINKLGGSIEGI